MAADVPAETDAPAETATPKRGFQFPSAVTTLAIVTVLVWVAAIFIPAGRYDTAADGSPKPGTFREVDSPLSAGERVEQLILAPINGTYGLQNPETEFVSTETVGRMFGQIGVIVFIMAIGAFISVSFSTQALEVAVQLFANPDIVNVLKTRYGIYQEFSGLGLSVKTYDNYAPMSANVVLGQSVVPEYLVKNATLVQGECRCIRVEPYVGRENDPLDPDFISQIGSADCPVVSHLQRAR